MRIGVPRESFPGENRVALTPAAATALKKSGLDVVVEREAGNAAGFTDAAYEQAGASLVSRSDVFSTGDILLQVRSIPPETSTLHRGQVVIGFADPLGSPDAIRALAEASVTAFSMELMPRITRAQSMDALSSMATIAGYKGVLMAANHLPRMFPMLMTAAGTLTAARVFIVGAGVAGLQAIATARRLGARVEAYDVRPAVKEQVQSMGARFVEFALETKDAEDKGGYAKAQDEAFYRRQREMMLKVVAANDVVVTTALIPGKKAPILITTDMNEAMAPGSVLVDLAAERGGNCELTRADQVVVHRGVTILGPSNPPALVPNHASQMYSKNITTFLAHLLGKDGAKKPSLELDLSDEITRETLLTRDGEVVHARVKELLSAGTRA
ncbi:MAG TPA: Re/Si-specific NAD(P)(+) transhydrogenase subunit alpha [Vicinamibacterales bacterium]|jgi:NAD(P) transhydrogenase subunit alpha|nr:Re/Si-specific NAD(P)(+) transhydrogenase subunit alpha [Vicinamibacterales bacterium]